MSKGPAKGAGRGGPARGYSWPPFAEGNTVALRHGAYSPRVFQPIAAELAAGVLEDRPDLELFGFAVAAWAEAEARAALLREYVADKGMFDGKGRTREGPLKWLHRFEKQADQLRQRLGLDPRAAWELARSRTAAQREAVDLDGLRARGAEIIAARDTDAAPHVSEAASGAEQAELESGDVDGGSDEEADDE